MTTGHEPITICHNVEHNPHEITVDADSVDATAHAAHLESGFDSWGSCPVEETTTTTTEAPTTTTTIVIDVPIDEVFPLPYIGVPDPTTLPPAEMQTQEVAVSSTVAEVGVPVTDEELTLAYTGSQAFDLTCLAGVLLAVGFGLTRLSKRPERRVRWGR